MKAGLIIATAEILSRFQVVLYQNLFACKGSGFTSAIYILLLGFLTVFSHGISEFQTIL
jgi:hypothetical protein